MSPLSLQRLQLNISEILTCHMKVHWGSGVDCITFFYKIFYDLTCEPVWLVSIKKNQMAIFARAKCHVHFLHSSDRGAQFPFLVYKKITIQWLMAFSFHVHNFFSPFSSFFAHFIERNMTLPLNWSRSFSFSFISTRLYFPLILFVCVCC